MTRFNAAAYMFAALGVVVLAGCEEAPVKIDPLSITGTEMGKKAVGYDALMRIGAAAHAGGDLATAISVYRHAAAVAPQQSAPFVAAGNTLLEMGNVNEAVVAFNSALARNPQDAEALRGLARADLHSGRPELAGPALAQAYKAAPNDPKLLELIGVADDFAGQHEEAQARYRRGLELLPGDPGLSLDLAMSLALTGNYPEAIAILRPIAMSPTASAGERQTLALIYGLEGNGAAAAAMAARDLDPQQVQRNLAYYESLRRLTPEARARAVQTLSAGAVGASPREHSLASGS